jgi:hypothetical protein
MFNNLKYTLIASMFLLATTNAASVAVLEITLSYDEADLSVDETKFLTDELRRQAMRTLPKDYSVLTREKIISLVPKTAENLRTAIDIGIAIKSTYVTQGFIGKVGGLFTLAVELYETSSGNLLGDFAKESTDYKGLLEAIRENAPDLFTKIIPKEEQIQTPIVTNISTEPKKSKNSFWIAIGLDALGAAAIGLGIYNNSKSIDYYNESKKLIENAQQHPEKQSAFDANTKKMQSAETARNIFYATGGALLLGGIAVHIWF